MTKFLGSVALTAIMASSLSAENLSDAESANQAHTESTTPPPPTEVLKSKESKSGFFLGIEGNLGGVTVYGNDYVFDSSSVWNKQTDSQFAFDGGLKFGYQHYFNQEALGVKQAFGLNVGLFVGAGTSATQLFDGFLPKYDLDPSQNIDDWRTTFDVSYLPIKTGIEMNFLWDFFEKEEHTLGLTVGIGYRFGYYKSLKNKDNFIQRSVDEQTGEKTKMVSSVKSKDLMTHSIYPQIGLHYYYGNHQFDFNYRFGGVLGGIATKEMTSVDSYYGYEAKILESSYFTFGYSYRF